MLRSLYLTTSFLFIGFIAWGQQDSVKHETDKEENFVKVDKSAEFPGGLRKFYEYVNQNLKYPQAAKKNAIYGKLYVEFVINTDGSIDDESVKVLPPNEALKSSGTNGPEVISDKECEFEAIRVLKDCPDWKPASHKGNPARQKLVIPIIFKQ